MKSFKPIARCLLTIFVFSSGVVLSGELKTAVEFQRDRESICTSEWTKRGVLDRSMYDFCITQHVEAYFDLAPFHRQYNDQGWYSDYAFPYCDGEWTKRGVSNATMILYCLNQELEGVRDFQYYMEQQDSKIVEQIANRAMATYKSWNMVAYEVKKHFD